MTEKNYNPKQKENASFKKKRKQETKTLPEAMKEQPKKEKIVVAPEKIDVKKMEENKEEVEEKKQEVVEKTKSEEEKIEKKKEEPKKPIQKKPIVKRNEAVVNAQSVHVSTLHSIAICKFIKNKSLEKAIEDLNLVLQKKKAVPMKGEIPHRKGKGMMSGRYPKKAVENFIKLIKSLQGNCNNFGIENPVVSEAIANLASRPYGKFGRVQRKRTHVKLVAKENASFEYPEGHEKKHKQESRTSPEKENKLGKGKKDNKKDSKKVNEKKGEK